MKVESVDQWIKNKKGIESVCGIAVPVLNTILVNRELVQANTYNPNSVPDKKMDLLRQSIEDNGFAFPIVTIYDEDLEKFVIIDGFHRYMVSGEKYLNMTHIPIVVLDHNISQRMIATIQFNKARGHHQVDLDADVVNSLLRQGMSESEISKHLGIDLDTVHRYKQTGGVVELFQNVQYSMSWSMVEVEK